MENSSFGYSEFIKKLTALILDYEDASGDNIHGLTIKRAVLKGGKRVFKIMHYGEQQSSI